MSKGPRSGYQAMVKYCPNCTWELKPVESRNRDATQSHKYKCNTCHWTSEINDLGQAIDVSHLPDEGQERIRKIMKDKGYDLT